jgi:hypothetical protein
MERYIEGVERRGRTSGCRQQSKGNAIHNARDISVTQRSPAMGADVGQGDRIGIDTMAQFPRNGFDDESLCGSQGGRRAAFSNWWIRYERKIFGWPNTSHSNEEDAKTFQDSF